jgi:hypothetical protein
MRNEADVKAEVKKILAKLGAWWFMPVQTGYGVKGVPDFVVCVDGRFVGIETKFGKNKESVWQQKQGAAIQAANGVYLVINENNVDQLEGLLT